MNRKTSREYKAKTKNLKPVAGQLIPYRCMTLTIPVPIMQAQQRLKIIFAQDIILKRRQRTVPTRYYRGHLTQNQLVLIGPRLNSLFLFRTHGRLISQGDHIALQLLIQLNHQYTYILVPVSIAAFLIAFILPIFEWRGLEIIPLYLGSFYVIVQWYLQYYSNEICELLKDIITDTSTYSGLKPEQESVRLQKKS